MTRAIILGLSAVVFGGSALAQQGYPVPGPLNYLPYYNQPTNVPAARPPLSPYLNLLNGNNPALNYYYGVRPLLTPTPTPTQPPVPQQNFAPATRTAFFQPLAPDIELSLKPGSEQKFILPSPGSPVAYGNSFGSSRAGVRTGVGAPSFNTVGQGGGGGAPSGSTAPASKSVPNTIPKSK
jgi:hypothetical protein